MNWIQAIIDYFGKLWPFERLEPWERGIRISYVPWEIGFHKWGLHGIAAHTSIEHITEGAHLVLWYFQRIEKESVVGQVMDLLSQTVMTKDGKQVSFSVNIEYEIDDIESNMTKVHAFHESLEASCRIHLARRVRELTYDELIEKQGWLEASLKGTLTTRARKWGTKIVDVGFTDLAVSKAFRILGDNKYV